MLVDRQVKKMETGNGELGNNAVASRIRIVLWFANMSSIMTL